MPASIPIKHCGTFTSLAAIRVRETFSRTTIVSRSCAACSYQYRYQSCGQWRLSCRAWWCAPRALRKPLNWLCEPLGAGARPVHPIRVNARQRSSTSVVFGAKQTLTEPALTESGFMSTCPRRGTRVSPAVSGAGSRQLRQVIQHHERVHLGRIGRALDRGHVVIGVGVLVFAGAEIRRPDADVVEVALIERGRRVVGLRRLAQHDRARAQDRLDDG